MPCGTDAGVVTTVLALDRAKSDKACALSSPGKEAFRDFQARDPATSRNLDYLCTSRDKEVLAAQFGGEGRDAQLTVRPVDRASIYRIQLFDDRAIGVIVSPAFGAAMCAAMLRVSE